MCVGRNRKNDVNSISYHNQNLMRSYSTHFVPCTPTHLQYPIHACPTQSHIHTHSHTHTNTHTHHMFLHTLNLAFFCQCRGELGNEATRHPQITPTHLHPHVNTHLHTQHTLPHILHPLTPHTPSPSLTLE